MKYLLFILLTFPILVLAQEKIIVAGITNQDFLISESSDETYDLYAPSTYNASRSYPIIVVVDFSRKNTPNNELFLEAAEKEGILLVTSNSLNNKASFSDNILVLERMLRAVKRKVQISKNSIYIAGIGEGARFATVAPLFMKDIKGVLSCGAPMANLEILDANAAYNFVGIVNRNDYNLREMIQSRKILDKYKIYNQLYIYDGVATQPTTNVLVEGMRALKLATSDKQVLKSNENDLNNHYEASLDLANKFLLDQNILLADHYLSEMVRMYEPYREIHTLKKSIKERRKTTIFKTSKRAELTSFLKEDLGKQDYEFYLNEDVKEYNFSNLGWWKYQMEALDILAKSSILLERQRASRLRGYLYALVSDTIDSSWSSSTPDKEALSFMYMLRTIISPEIYTNYLAIISLNASMNDHDTALYYLEELLKSGYINRKQLYDLEHTALLKITPEYNDLIDAYLDNARY